ncbi:MAG: arginine deiminase-related protein, partial [Bacteroidota bacterium]|nr:arginine deiminase-related protein [Bacteroidota bacterium]
MKQVATTILMIRPASFGYNAETAASNVFQGNVTLTEKKVQQKAVNEFDAFVNKLRSHNINVLVIEDTPLPQKPDAIFPNNWFCTLNDGTVA